MFQSVAPRPGKIVFELEPFPAPNLQVVSEGSSSLKVTEQEMVLPALEAVAAEEPEIEAAVEQEFALEEVVVMEECGDLEQESVVEEPVALEPVESLAQTVAAPVSPFFKVNELDEEGGEETPVSEFGFSPAADSDSDDVLVEASEAPVAEAAESIPEVFASPASVKNPFAAATISEERENETEAANAPVPDSFHTAKTVEIEAQVEEVSSPISSTVEEQPASEAVAQETTTSPVVTSWQPPAPSGKKKSSRIGGFFRQ